MESLNDMFFRIQPSVRNQGIFILRFSQVTGFLILALESHIPIILPHRTGIVPYIMLHVLAGRTPFYPCIVPTLGISIRVPIPKGKCGYPNLYHHVPTRLHRVYGGRCRQQSARVFYLPERTQNFPLTL